MLRFDSRKFVKIRKRKKMNKEAVAYFAGVSLESVKNWEKGKVVPSGKHIGVLASLFKVKIDSFYTKEV